MERFLFTKLSILIMIALILQMYGYKGCMENERAALLEIKAFYINSSSLKSWVDDRVSDCCNWDQVECSTTTSRVINLSLSQLFYGPSTTILNFSLFDPFEELQSLNLSYNNFEGCVGAGLANLINLEILDLSRNRISGSPLELAQLWSYDGNLEFWSYDGISGSLQELGICELKNLIQLNLSTNNFEGHLPLCLNNLTNLRVLDLSFNNFEGLFSFGSLVNLSKLEIFSLSTKSSSLQVQETENFPQPPTYQLKVLYLSNCNLHAIPSFLMYQHSLEVIDLSHNKLVGMFPTWLLVNNARLERMYLVNNSFTGILQLPNSTHGLLQLKVSDNNLNGQLPEIIGVILPRLLDLDLSENSFQGSIPSSSAGLRIMDLSNNNFSGELSKSFISGCFSLEILRLSNNNLHGEIFSEFMNMTQLQALFLDNNKFSGNIQHGLSKAVSLYVLDLSNNFFSGQIPHWIGNFSNLWALSMSNNLLEGDVPIPLSNIKGLLFLDISKNRLSGSIASAINLSSVQHLYMQKNALSGSIPNAFFRSSSRSIILDLRDNEFSGSFLNEIDSIPDAIDGGLSNLNVLLLAGNHLEGHIPHELCRLEYMRILDLSHNKLSGSIPSCFTNMQFWSAKYEEYSYSIQCLTLFSHVEFCVASYNFTLDFKQADSDEVSHQKLKVEFVTKNRHESYEGSILRYMTGIDLSSNELTGDVPSEFGYLQQIHAVNLSHNSLSGSIPESISNLTNVESLDISHNKLSGRIPPQLTQLSNIGTFNVSFNNLSGPVPDKEQFGTFDESSYRGNSGLCGPQIKRSCNSEPMAPPATSSGAGEEDESAIDRVSFYWSFFASWVTTILTLVLVIWLNSYWRRQWFYFIDECIITCYCWILRYVFHKY
ncbi:hypothetical protein ACOSQ2_024002 [Xanthoceras sorbifolium]